MWDKADYYREETLRALRSNDGTSGCWTAGAQALGFAVDGPEFRRRFAREVAMDSYAGLFLGQLQAGLKPMERPMVNFEATARLQKELRLLDDDEERELADAMVAAGSKEGGGDFLVEAMRLFPGQRVYAGLAMQQVHIAAARELQAAVNAPTRIAVIKKTTGAAEKVRNAAPWCADCYQLIGMMEHERAIILANQKELRASFEAIARAASYFGPGTVAATRDQLDQIHAALRQRAAHINAQLISKPGAQLTSEGRQLVSMADNATKDAERWEQSSEAKEIAALRDASEASPERDLIQARDGVTPLVRTDATAKAPGEPRFADWLGSHPGRWVRRQVAAAAILLVATVCFSGWQIWAAHSVSSARQRVDKAVAAGMNAEALDDFLAAPKPLHFDRDQDTEMAQLYRTTLARWAAARAQKGGSISEEDRRRISRFKELVEDASGGRQ